MVKHRLWAASPSMEPKQVSVVRKKYPSLCGTSKPTGPKVNPKNRLCTMPMFQYPNFLYIDILMIPHKIRPYKSHTHERDEFLILSMYLMCILYIESRGFHDLEKSLNLPSVLVCLYGMFNLKFRLSVGVLKPRTDQILWRRSSSLSLTRLNRCHAQTFSPDFGFTIQKFCRIRM